MENEEYREEYEDNSVTNADIEVEETDVEEKEASGSEAVELAPSILNPIAYIKFMANKKNRKDKFWNLKPAIRGRVIKEGLLALVLIALGIILSVMTKNPKMLVVPFIVAFICILMTLKDYFDGVARQYVEIRGTVVKSDYAKSAFEMARAGAKKAAKADFQYRSFLLKTNEGELLKFNCNKAKELPQEGDKLRITCHARTPWDEDEGLTKMSGYISIDRIT